MLIVSLMKFPFVSFAAEVSVIVAVPGVFAVTRPLSLTVATAGALLCQL